MKLSTTESIFDTLTDRFQFPPESLRPIQDRLLVRDIPDEQNEGSIVLPESAQDRGVGKGGSLRLGIVIAVGRGDSCREKTPVKRIGEPQRRRFVAVKCSACVGVGCERCDQTGMGVEPTVCKPGDKIIYDRRREAEIHLEGQRYTLIHEEQSVLAIVE